MEKTIDTIKVAVAAGTNAAVAIGRHMTMANVQDIASLTLTLFQIVLAVMTIAYVVHKWRTPAGKKKGLLNVAKETTRELAD